MNKYDRMTEAELVEMVSKNAYILQCLDNPSEAVCMAAVVESAWSIHDIENPSEAVCMAAVGEQPYAVRHIKNPSEAVCLAAVKLEPGAVAFIHKPISDTVYASLLIYHPLYPDTPKEILDRAPEILEAHCPGLADVYLIGLSIGMGGDELSGTMIEWAESHSLSVDNQVSMTP